MFWMDEELGSDIYLDGIITLVDAKFGPQQLKEKREDGLLNEAVKQIALADVILLNKTDLIEDRSEIRHAIEDINSSANVIETKKSQINLSCILDLHAYDGKGIFPVKFQNETRSGEHIDRSVGTVTLRLDEPIDLDKLELFLQELLWEDRFVDSSGNKLQVLRLKGLVSLVNKDKPIIIQGVHDTYDIYETSTDCSSCTLVIIGRHLEHDQLQKALSNIINA